MAEETMSTPVVEEANVETNSAPETDTAPRELDSVTKEYEDALYSKDESSDSVEAKPEGEKAESSEDPGKDEVAKDEDAKAKEKSEGEEIQYDLKWEEDSSLLSEKAMENVVAFAKEHKLSNEVAKLMWERENNLVQTLAQGEDARVEKELEEWRNEVINDPQLGGENLGRTVEGARRVVQRFGDEDLTNLLRDTGYGDNPAIVKFLYKISSVMSEDSLVLGGKGAPADKPLEDYFYKN